MNRFPQMFLVPGLGAILTGMAILISPDRGIAHARAGAYGHVEVKFIGVNPGPSREWLRRQCEPMVPKTIYKPRVAYIESDCDTCAVHFEEQENADLQAQIRMEETAYGNCLRQMKVWLERVRPVNSKEPVTCKEARAVAITAAKEIESREKASWNGDHAKMAADRRTKELKVLASLAARECPE